MGTRESAGDKPKKRFPLRKILGVFLILAIGLGIGSILYWQRLEALIRNRNSRKIDDLVNAPTPGQPVTFLIIGCDSRGKNDPGRSDTLMVVRINPTKKIVSIISIPRDTRVRIPGHGKDKINAAYAIGDGELALKTVKQFTGLEFNHYVSVDFLGFKKIVDALGGIDINVQPPGGKSRLVDPDIGLNLPKGMQHLNGDEALKFVRVRHVDDDFGRTKRQQQFLKAVFDKALDPTSLVKLPGLPQLLAENLQTDSGLSLQDMLSYFLAVRSMPKENIHMATLPGDPKWIGDVSYVIPDDTKVTSYFERMKYDLPFELTKEELANAAITVDVENGCGVAGRGRALGDLLGARGFTIGIIGDAERSDHERTQILASSETYDDAKKVRDALGMGEIVSDPTNGQALTVVVGRDFNDPADPASGSN
ncbi:MAG: LCP family protein [Chloroflexi bacterium]|nr:LCP family protein [Chloroflexota bacterium]